MNPIYNPGHTTAIYLRIENITITQLFFESLEVEPEVISIIRKMLQLMMK